jgi:hypothetical protein
MNKANYILLIFVLAVFSLWTENVFATVGGPTYISSIAFNTKDNSVYYQVHDYGGKGCPVILHKIDLTTLKDSEVKSCDQVLEEYFFPEGDTGKYNQFISDIYQNFSYLGSINLKKNNVDVQVEFISEHIEDGYTLWTEFRANIIQDNKEIAKINFQGCSKDQPHVFEGYMIPNSNAMAILISNKGDCFEGGYVEENLQVIKGIKYYDTNIVRSIKDESATEPNLANMVVYATLNDIENNDNVSVPQKNPAANVVLLVATFAVGIMLGYVVGRKSSRSIEQ